MEDSRGFQNKEKRGRENNEYMRRISFINFCSIWILGVEWFALLVMTEHC